MTVEGKVAFEDVFAAANAMAGATGSREFPLALPAISPAEVASINAFYRHRPPLTFSVAGRTAALTASWPPAPDDGLGRFRIDITVDDTPGVLTVSRSLVAAIVAGLDQDQGLEHLQPRHLALLLELAFTDALQALEASLGSRLAIEAVNTVAGGSKVGAVSLAFDLAVDGLGASFGELLLHPRLAAKLTRLLDRRAAAAPFFVPPSQSGEVTVPLPVSIRVAATTCSVGEIASLSPGDVVMADHCCRPAQTAVAVVGEHLVAPVALAATSARIIAPLARIQGSLWEWSMENGSGRPQADVMQQSGLDDIPVKLVFELGRVELSLAEVRQLAPGALIGLSHPIEESVDISANGRRIGRGSLVQIGSNVGVRITRLFHNGCRRFKSSRHHRSPGRRRSDPAVRRDDDGISQNLRGDVSDPQCARCSADAAQPRPLCHCLHPDDLRGLANAGQHLCAGERTPARPQFR
jgi:type III secretion protein Q